MKSKSYNEKQNISYNFYCEYYQNEADFAYFNDSEYEIDNENLSVYNLQISAYPASDKVKKKFCFPRDDPSESVIS